MRNTSCNIKHLSAQKAQEQQKATEGATLGQQSADLVSPGPPDGGSTGYLWRVQDMLQAREQQLLPWLQQLFRASPGGKCRAADSLGDATLQQLSKLRIVVVTTWTT